MKKEILENKIRFLYKYREGSHTSFSIALEAGANNENEEEKNEKKKGEEDIKEIEIF